MMQKTRPSQWGGLVESSRPDRGLNQNNGRAIYMDRGQALRARADRAIRIMFFPFLHAKETGPDYPAPVNYIITRS